MKNIITYLDPGSGFVFAQNSPILWSIILWLFGFFILLFGLFFKFLKRFIWFFIILLIILIIGGLIMLKPVSKKNVLVLGIDAMDPKITEKLIQEGRMPNFSYLKKIGSYSQLATTIPAESAVAWTSFATGLNPGDHGIFDFIMRDSQTYFLYLSLNEISTVNDKIKIQTRKKGNNFWNILSENNIPCFIYFCPNTFPPDKILGRMLSGMGVPDLYGTMGRFTFYTTKELTDEDKDSRGRIIYLESKNNVIETKIYGPKLKINNLATEITTPLRIVLKPNEKNISLQFQGNSFSLKEGEWSDWQSIYFKTNFFKKTQGIAKYYLRSIEPKLELYMTAINFDPQRPLFSISYPANYSKKLAKKVGLYYTQGMPHDTWALTENRIDEKAFLEQVDDILGENERILKEELNKFRKGLFFYYFETLDIIQHMFWRYLDSQHPLYEENSLYQDTIFKYYEKIDQILGNVLGKLDEDATLIVLSDHGFSSFRKSVHLNRWLLENGYLFLKEGRSGSKEFFEEVDWSKTRAYSAGFGGIYLNRIGRENYGIVNKSDTQELKEGIAKSLKQFKDPQTGKAVVNNVYFSEKIFKGSCMDSAPDLFVGFSHGFRASWQTALGGVPRLLIEDNRKKWSGGHLIDPLLVPGVIFVNKKVDLKNLSIIDIVPTILNLFNIDKFEDMEGRALF
jgi:predicted AlkP superfamily phosphohydrolase/phosphomutase